jgi:hypothetical protein
MNLRAVQLLLGHPKLESTVRYLGIEVDDALKIAEQTKVQRLAGTRHMEEGVCQPETVFAQHYQRSASSWLEVNDLLPSTACWAMTTE